MEDDSSTASKIVPKKIKWDKISSLNAENKFLKKDTLFRQFQEYKKNRNLCVDFGDRYVCAPSA